MGAKICATCQLPKISQQDEITTEPANRKALDIPFESATPPQESVIINRQPQQQQQDHEIAGAWGRSVARKQTVKQNTQAKSSVMAPRKSAILTGIVQSAITKCSSDIVGPVDLVVPTHITQTLMIMGPFVKDEPLVKMFDDCTHTKSQKLSDGSIYDGQWSDGIRTGYGKMLYPDLSFYEGFWINNEKHFDGRFVDKDGDGYSGQWFANEMHGNGKFYHSDSTTYEIHSNFEEKAAKILESQPEPILSLPDGWKYYGDCFECKKHGFGVLKWEDGTQYYGFFKFNLMDGYGVMSFSNGQRYEGQFEDDKMHGLGTYTWPNGNMFIGLYENDKKQGYGMFIWPDGNKYRGQFNDNQQTGFGRMILAKGKVIEAQWVNGKRIKDAQQIDTKPHSQNQPLEPIPEKEVTPEAIESKQQTSPHQI